MEEKRLAKRHVGTAIVEPATKAMTARERVLRHDEEARRGDKYDDRRRKIIDEEARHGWLGNGSVS